MAQITKNTEQFNFSEFTKITSMEQRNQYKTTFDNDYAEYLKLRTVNEEAAMKFAQFQELLIKAKNDKQQLRKVSKSIIYINDLLMNEKSFLNGKKRFEYLHHKLAHLKKLVKEFDSSIEKSTRN